MKNFDVLVALQKCTKSLLRKMAPDPSVIAARAQTFANLAKRASLDVVPQVPQSFQGEMASFIKEMETIFSGFATNQNDVGAGLNALLLNKSAGPSKTIEVKCPQIKFTKWAAAQINKAIAEGGSAGVVRLRKLDAGLQATLDGAIKKGASFEEDASMTVTVENDPMALMWRQVDGSIVNVAGENVAPSQFAEAPDKTFLPIPVPSTETDGSLVAEASSNTAPSNSLENPGDLNKPGPTVETVGVEAVLAGVRDVVVKYESDIPFVGWGFDLNRPEFRDGVRKEDFGKDGTKRDPGKWADFRR